jgi:C4-dicarboxylate-specific signal transduction histidine kinase
MAEAASLQRLNELARMNRLATAGELSASIAHEIRQPLAAIASSGSAGLNWLKNKVPNLEEARAALQTIVNQSHRADEVIKSIRIMFDRGSAARTVVNLNEVVDQVLALTSRTISSHKIALVIKLPDYPLPLVMADPVQLQQVVLNLIMNAVEAMASSDNRFMSLRIETGTEQTGVVWLAVVDSGPGLDASVAEDIFKPFVTTKAKGMGMGLSICKSIIEQHQGQLVAAPVEPRGLMFRITLPNARAA